MSSIPPLDGHSGTCASMAFPIPLCIPPNVNPTTYLANHHAITPLTSWNTLTARSIEASLNASSYTAALTLATLTLAYILVLTHPRKKHSWIYRLSVPGLCAVLIRSACGLWQCTRGPSGSLYLAVTWEYGSTTYSGGYRTAIVLAQTSSVVALACVQVVFFLQARALLVWVRVKYACGARVYHGVLAVFVALGCVSWVYRVAFAAYQVFWTAFTPEGVWVSEVWVRWWYNHLLDVSGMLITASLMGWSLVFFVSAVKVLIVRREVLSSTRVEVEGRGKRVKRRNVRNAYEVALSSIALVGVEGFVVPIVLSIFRFAAKSGPFVDVLIMPIILALLPLSSLLVHASSQDGPEALDLHVRMSSFQSEDCQPISMINKISNSIAREDQDGAVELYTPPTESGRYENRPGGEGARTKNNFEREMQAFGRIG